MPRLDNTDRLVIAEFDLDFDPGDPGETPPVDLCWGCYIHWQNMGLEVDHPPYEDNDYECFGCMDPLNEDDN